MTKNNLPTKQRPLPLVVVAVLALLAIVVFLTWPKKPAPTTTTTPDLSAVTITTQDGIQLSATTTYPVRNIQVPVVILLHDYGQDRHQWDLYVQKFVDSGFAVLRYDMRGFGDSRLSSIPKDKPAHLKMLPRDLPAVFEYLQQQPQIDPAKINIIGAGVGANVGLVASGSQTGIDRVVLLSPTVSPGVLDGSGIENFFPKNVLGVAGTTDIKDLQTVMSHVAGIKEEYVVDGGSAGVSLLSNEQTMMHILNWLQS